jgi:DNA glycosylase AlkZ-like
VSAALTGKTLVEVLGPRMVPTLARPDEIAIFTVGGIGADPASLRAVIGQKACRQLAVDGIELPAALARVSEAARAELEGGARTRGDLSKALTARLPPAMSLWCKRCGSRHIHETLFRLAGAIGAYCIAPRSGREVSYILVQEWLGTRVPCPGSPEALVAGSELLRRFLRCYGPASPADFADWSKTGLPDAQRRFASLAGELQDVCWCGATGSVLREDAEDLRRSELPSGIRFLPPNDPYLLARDRETLVPDAALRKVIWPAAGTPGTLLASGEIVATWRSQKKDTTLRVQVSPHDQLRAGVVAVVEQEAQILARLRGCWAAVVEFA